ncbi:MAG TPA: T9SS type A sorting domain-containing protein [Chitinophagaceae bacterium]|nr:T9SS type A sorting domain-containing protein [Chitinophagaceae bacterium]
MKKILSVYALFVCAGTPFTSKGQEANWFEAEGNTYYIAESCIPHSDVLFQASRGGGKLLKRSTADENGRLIVAGNDAFKPAFVLNTKHKNTGGVAGSGVASFYENKEFSFSNPGVRVADGVNRITWETEVAGGVNLYFEVLKSVDLVTYTPIGSIPAAKGVAVTVYEDPVTDGAVYKVAVVNNEKGLRYTSKVIAPLSSGVKVYPTVVDDKFNIDLAHINASGSYKIINGSGQVVQKGKLNQQHNTVGVSNLSRGNYIVIVEAEGQVSSSKAIKM